MQTSCRRADQVGQAAFDVHVHIFERALEEEIAAGDFLLDAQQAFLDGVAVFRADNALGHQHGTVSAAAVQILLGKALVKPDGDVNLLHDGGGTGGEPTAPNFTRHMLALA